MTIEPISLYVYFRFRPVISIAMINHLCPAGSAFFQLANPFPEAFVSRFLVHLEHIYYLENARLVEPLLCRQVHVLKKSRLALAHFASDRTKHSQDQTVEPISGHTYIRKRISLIFFIKDAVSHTPPKRYAYTPKLIRIHPLPHLV